MTQHVFKVAKALSLNFALLLAEMFPPLMKSDVNRQNHQFWIIHPSFDLFFPFYHEELHAVAKNY